MSRAAQALRQLSTRSLNCCSTAVTSTGSATVGEVAGAEASVGAVSAGDVGMGECRGVLLLWVSTHQYAIPKTGSNKIKPRRRTEVVRSGVAVSDSPAEWGHGAGADTAAGGLVGVSPMAVCNCSSRLCRAAVTAPSRAEWLLPNPVRSAARFGRSRLACVDWKGRAVLMACD